MFERFTERARQVVVLAQQEARDNEQAYIGCEHIFLGLLREEEGLAAQVLTYLKVNLDEARQSALARATGSRRTEEGQIPFTPRAKKALELSLREALALGHNYIGTEHILLGLIREGDNVALGILRDDFGVTEEPLRQEVMRMLSGPKAPILKRDKESQPSPAKGKFQELRHAVGDSGLPRVTILRMLAEAVEIGRATSRPAETIAKAILAMEEA